MEILISLGARMRLRFYLFVGIISILFLIIAASWVSPVTADGLAQQPTGEIPTVTSTPFGPMITVRSDQEEFINVRSGPGIFFPKVGVLLKGQSAPAKGRSAGGDWIYIEYPGIAGGMAWVYSPFVNLTPGGLPIIEPPPTPTPLFTSTIDPTLAAQFIVTSIPTRLPTFTPPQPLVIPTFADPASGRLAGIPSGFIISSLIAIGVFLGLFSLAQGR
jgi:hypothetical protein